MTFEEFQLLLWLAGLLPVLLGIITMLPWSRFGDYTSPALVGSFVGLVLWPVTAPVVLTFKLGLIMRSSAARRRVQSQLPPPKEFD